MFYVYQSKATEITKHHFRLHGVGNQYKECDFTANLLLI